MMLTRINNHNDNDNGRLMCDVRPGIPGYKNTNITQDLPSPRRAHRAAVSLFSDVASTIVE